VDKFFFITRDVLDTAFANTSCLFVPILEFSTLRNEGPQEAFLHLLPGDKVTLTQKKISSLSITSLSGISEVSHAKLPTLNLSSLKNSPCFYVRFESFSGKFTITNLHNEESVLQIVFGDFLNAKFERSTQTHKLLTSDLYTEEKQFIKESERVFRIFDSPLKTIGFPQITGLQDHVAKSKDGQGRVCCHSQDSSKMQEMFLSFNQGITFPMMKHLDKSESLLILSGDLDYLIYSEVGEVIATIPMTGFQTYNNSNPKPFYIYINRNTYHSPLVKSETFLAKETTSGPFLPNQTVLLN